MRFKLPKMKRTPEQADGTTNHQRVIVTIPSSLRRADKTQNNKVSFEVGSANSQDAGSMDAGGSSTNSSFPGGYKKDPTVIGVQSEFASSTKLSAGSLVLLWQGASCLRMRSLRTQIWICFGGVSVMALLLVMSVSIWTTVHAGDTVIDVGARNIDQWFELRGPAMTRLMADAANEKLNALEGLFRITQQMTQERLFLDHSTIFANHFANNSNIGNQSLYPLRAKNLLPYENELIPNVFWNDSIAASEHVRHRHAWYFERTVLLDNNNSAWLDGNHQEDRAPLPNNISTIDAVFAAAANSDPVTTKKLRTDLSDYISPLLKALYEHHGEIKSIGLYFVNEQASVVFPGRVAQPPPRGNEIVGCDWLLQDNPFTQENGTTVGTPAQRALCLQSNARTTVEPSVLTHAWCRDQALEPQRMHVWDPSYDTDGMFGMDFGMALYHPSSHELVACTLVSVSGEYFGGAFTYASNEGFDAHWGTLRMNEQGTFVNATPWVADPINRTEHHLLGEYDYYGVTPERYQEIRDFYLESYRTSGRYNDWFYSDDRFYITIHPFPKPPPLDSPQAKNFRPDFMCIMTAYTSERDVQISFARGPLNDEVHNIVMVIALASVVSMLILCGVVYIVALYLTSPLQWMNRVGSEILEHAGSRSGQEEHPILQLERKPWTYRFSPRTEITRLVDEFHVMLKQFSGKGTAKVIKQDLYEVKNPFLLYNNFQMLYDERKISSYGPSRAVSTGVSFRAANAKRLSAAASLSLAPPPEQPATTAVVTENRKHWGPNTHTSGIDEENLRQDLHRSIVSSTKHGSLLRSSIFWWLCCCIAVPLMLSMVGISAYVLIRVKNSLPSLVATLEIVYTYLESYFMLPFAHTRVAFVTEALLVRFRDLYVLNRIAGWLYSGGLPAVNTFTEMNTFAEQCKEYSTNCPAYQNSPVSTCDCSWKDPLASPCTSDVSESRQYQRLYFEGLAEDAYLNGDRNFTSYGSLANTNPFYPRYGTSPNATFFWDSIENLPGASQTLGGASTFDTTYDRVRTASALSAVQIPLYNYLEGSLLEPSWGFSLTFDADGMTTGYGGCSDEHVYWAQYQFGNETARPDLCPDGKYGYDARCMEYYDEAKKFALESDNTIPFVTLPCSIIPGNPERLSRGVLPLIDPSSGEFVGQTEMRFSMEHIWRVIEDTLLGDKAFKMLLNAGKVKSPLDVVYVAGHTGSPLSSETIDAGASLASVLMPYDQCDNVFEYTESCNLLARFQRIASAIHDGFFSWTSFRRTSRDGNIEEVAFAFSPVILPGFRPVDPSDFSRGTLEQQKPILAVAFGQEQDDIFDTFVSVRDELASTLGRSMGLLIVVAVATLVVVCVVTYFMTLSVSIPVTQLYALVTSINHSEFSTEFPDFKSRSSEVAHVRATFERLHMLVKAANSAFFQGQLNKAYTTLHDAWMLFNKLDNRKAIGIANNNLGNVMLTMYRTMKKTSAPTLCGMSLQRIIMGGCTHFRIAIDTGEDALKYINDSEGWSENYLIFMQQLSNRYFNRAMFLLTVRDDHPRPHEAESQGLMDLCTCKDMDREVVDNGDREGFKGEKDVYFELLLGRIKGLLLLMRMGYDDEWGIDELLDGARVALVSALSSPEHTLFRDLEPAGQMQRLDSAMVEYYLLLANKEGDAESRLEIVTKAASFGVRMLYEDDYVIGEAALLALKALIDKTMACSSDDLGDEDPSDVRTTLFQYRQMISESIALSYGGKDLISREAFIAANIGDFSMEAF